MILRLFNSIINFTIESYISEKHLKLLMARILAKYYISTYQIFSESIKVYSIEILFKKTLQRILHNNAR